MLAAWRVTSTEESRGASAMVTAPSNSLKRPRTLLTIRCLALKPTLVWLASITYRPATGTSVPSKVRVCGAFSVMLMGAPRGGVGRCLRMQ